MRLEPPYNDGLETRITRVSSLGPRDVYDVSWALVRRRLEYIIKNVSIEQKLMIKYNIPEPK